MVSKCAAYKCPMIGTKQVTQSGIQFHKFPRDPELRAKWVRALRYVDFTPSRHSSVCSRHFESDCFEPPGYRKKQKLKRGSIPTIFDFPKHLQKRTMKRKPPKIRTDPPPKSALQIETVMCSTNFPGQAENLCEVFYDESHQPISLNQHNNSCPTDHQVDPLGIKTEENATIDTEFVIVNRNICDVNAVTEPCNVNSAEEGLDVISNSESCSKETFTSEVDIKDEEIVEESSTNQDITNEYNGDNTR
ncbi:hypothetical protein B566_EDAN010672 [Ephemera danica]|nr:hypothetical protein B566_EDAN010672 [Ephemera danica]